MALQLLLPVDNFDLHKSLQTFTAERLDPPLLANNFCLTLLLLLFGSLNGVVKLSDWRIHQGVNFLLNTSDTAPEDVSYRDISSASCKLYHTLSQKDATVMQAPCSQRNCKFAPPREGSWVQGSYRTFT